jgi:hypothetical protein
MISTALSIRIEVAQPIFNLPEEVVDYLLHNGYLPANYFDGNLGTDWLVAREDIANEGVILLENNLYYSASTGFLVLFHSDRDKAFLEQIQKAEFLENLQFHTSVICLPDTADAAYDMELLLVPRPQAMISWLQEWLAISPYIRIKSAEQLQQLASDCTQPLECFIQLGTHGGFRSTKQIHYHRSANGRHWHVYHEIDGSQEYLTTKELTDPDTVLGEAIQKGAFFAVRP